MDSHANVYVTSDECVRNVSLANGVVSTLEYNIRRPLGIAVSPKTNNVYVASRGAIIQISADGATSKVLTGSVDVRGYRDGDASTAEFNVVVGLAFSPSGDDLYISDTGNNCIRSYNVASNKVSTLAGRCGVFGYVDGPSTTAQFSRPESIAVGPDGSVYVCEYGADLGRVRRIKRVE